MVNPAAKRKVAAGFVSSSLAAPSSSLPPLSGDGEDESAAAKIPKVDSANPPGNSSASSSSSSSVSVSASTIALVQSLISDCLTRQMTQGEIIAVLKHQAHIHPKVTCFVWGQLEKRNPSLFQAYEGRLRLKDQIATFNYLVQQQRIFMQQSEVAGAASAHKKK